MIDVKVAWLRVSKRIVREGLGITPFGCAVNHSPPLANSCMNLTSVHPNCPRLTTIPLHQGTSNTRGHGTEQMFGRPSDLPPG